MGGLSGIQSSVTNGFVDTAAALCNGFAGVNASIANGFAQAEIANNARQIADMQTNFGLQSQLAQCCCDNRLASADLKYTIATENCADRTALADGLRDVLESQSAGVQRILDQMCNDKIDAKNERIADLERADCSDSCKQRCTDQCSRTISCTSSTSSIYRAEP